MLWKSMLDGQMAEKTPYDKFIGIGGVNYHYREYPAPSKKKARHVVMLHGFASSTYTWEKIDRRLNEEGYHVWSLDMKGFGWSEKPRKSPYDTLTLLEEVAAWFEAMKIKDAVVVGNSYGGGIAVLLAFNYPSLVERVVPIDAGAFRMKLPLIMKLMKAPLSNEIGKLFYGKWVTRLILGEVYYNKKLLTDEQIEAYHQRMSTANAIDTQVFLVKAIDFEVNHRYTDRLAEVKQKALILWGQNDKWIPLEIGYRFHEALPHSRMVVIPRCGHIPQEEKPEAVYRLISDFIRDRDVYKSLPGELRGDVYYLKD